MAPHGNTRVTSQLTSLPVKGLGRFSFQGCYPQMVFCVYNSVVIGMSGFGCVPPSPSHPSSLSSQVDAPPTYSHSPILWQPSTFRYRIDNLPVPSISLSHVVLIYVKARKGAYLHYGSSQEDQQQQSFLLFFILFLLFLTTMLLKFGSLTVMQAGFQRQVWKFPTWR